MNIREQVIMFCFLFSSSMATNMASSCFCFTNSGTNKLEGCKSYKFCYSLPNKPLSFFFLVILSHDNSSLQLRNFISLSAVVVFRFASFVNKLNT